MNWIKQREQKMRKCEQSKSRKNRREGKSLGKENKAVKTGKKVRDEERKTN